MTTRAVEQPEYGRRTFFGSKATAGAPGGRPTWGQVLLKAFVMLLAFLALVTFSAVLAKLTLTPSPASDGIAGSNLHPGRSLRQYAEQYTFLAACKQVGGNLVLGAPFGVLLPLLVPGRMRMRMLRVLVITLVVMALVELAQGAVIEGRAFDVDDVILNTTGAMLGYVLLGRKLARAVRDRTEAVAAPEPVPAEGAARTPRTPKRSGAGRGFADRGRSAARRAVTGRGPGRGGSDRSGSGGKRGSAAARKSGTSASRRAGGTKSGGTKTGGAKNARTRNGKAAEAATARKTVRSKAPDDRTVARGKASAKGATRKPWKKASDTTGRRGFLGFWRGPSHD